MYGTIIDNQLHPAPRGFLLHGAMVTNPKAEHFADLNVEREKKGLPPYLPVVDTPPTTDAAHYAVPTGWSERGGEIVRQYEARAYPPPPPRPSPISRRWRSPRATLPQRRWTDCDYIEEGYGGDEKWNAILDGAARALGKTRAEIEAFLGSLPTE